eukprot:7845278-Alexandrium_andersonii.AAC.1
MQQQGHACSPPRTPNDGKLQRLTVLEGIQDMTFWGMVAVAKATRDTLMHFLFWAQKRFDED